MIPEAKSIRHVLALFDEGFYITTVTPESELAAQIIELALKNSLNFGPFDSIYITRSVDLATNIMNTLSLKRCISYIKLLEIEGRYYFACLPIVICNAGADTIDDVVDLFFNPRHH